MKKREGSTREGEEKEILKREGKQGGRGRGRGCETETRGFEKTTRKMPCGCTSNPKHALRAVASGNVTLKASRILLEDFHRMEKTETPLLEGTNKILNAPRPREKEQ